MTLQRHMRHMRHITHTLSLAQAVGLLNCRAALVSAGHGWLVATWPWNQNESRHIRTMKSVDLPKNVLHV